MYRQAEWAMAIRLTGQAPIGGLKYEMERLRCGLCGKVETASLPENAGPDKYDPSVASVIGYFRYGAGMPWSRIERVQRNAGIPLDNNIAERMLKMAIRHRRNSLFYKTQRGADVGDVYMSLIHTCYFAEADPIDYLTELQRNASRVQEDPSQWLPWNYREQLAAK
jgi:hypothetical protein